MYLYTTLPGGHDFLHWFDLAEGYKSNEMVIDMFYVHTYLIKLCYALIYYV